MGRFDGKVAWITGGGTGIGRACALELGRQGAAVAVSGRRLDRLQAVVAELEAIGARALAVPCDVAKEDEVRAAVAQVVGALGGIDVLLANAGFGVAGKVVELSDADWRRQFDVNLFGLVSCVREAMPHLVARGGRVAVLGSVMAYLTLPKNGPYAASKAAVRMVGETLSMELAGSGVSCTTIHPGFIESEIGQVDNEGVFREDRRDRRPAKLMWKAEDAARVMVDGLYRRRREVLVTGHGKVAVWLARFAPWLISLAGPRM
jgi:NAD(P)-dependent dehydrogenase (short-subunit alcohol dehydrogenase family)